MKTKLSDNEEKVLQYLSDNRTLTTFKAVLILKIMNVADVIMRLRRYGYNIPDVEWKTSKNNKRYGVYRLIK